MDRESKKGDYFSFDGYLHRYIEMYDYNFASCEMWVDDHWAGHLISFDDKRPFTPLVENEAKKIMIISKLKR